MKTYGDYKVSSAFYTNENDTKARSQAEIEKWTVDQIVCSDFSGKILGKI